MSDWTVSDIYANMQKDCSVCVCVKASCLISFTDFIVGHVK